jgi:hypothetical protein
MLELLWSFVVNFWPYILIALVIALISMFSDAYNAKREWERDHYDD